MKLVFNGKIYDGVVIIPVYENEIIKEDKFKINDELKYLYDMRIFEGKEKQTHFIHKNDNYIIFGLGKREKCKGDILRDNIANGLKEAMKLKFEKISVYCSEQTKINEIVETLILTNYKFDKYKTDEDKYEISILNIIKDGDLDLDKVENHVVLAESTIIARTLSNEPSNVLTPTELANRAVSFGKKYGFEVEVLGKSEIIKENMHAFLAVSSASSEEPKFIIMRYMGNLDNKDVIGLVGKGLTYDSGGLSIKPTASMITMKDDMSGASAVIGTMVAASRNKIKANIIAVVSACENMISGKSYKPGDIISSRSGKSIFIANTDAEGRLTLADSLDYILKKEKVSQVIDIATLTGAASQALGETTTALISNDDSMYNKMVLASKKADERVWRLPIYDDYRELMKHSDADLTNSGGKPGVITAAVFLENFVGEYPWIHLDIAGTSWFEKEKGYISKGATGVGVRLLYHYINGNE